MTDASFLFACVVAIAVVAVVSMCGYERRIASIRRSNRRQTAKLRDHCESLRQQLHILSGDIRSDRPGTDDALANVWHHGDRIDRIIRL